MPRASRSRLTVDCVTLYPCLRRARPISICRVIGLSASIARMDLRRRSWTSRLIGINSLLPYALVCPKAKILSRGVLTRRRQSCTLCAPKFVAPRTAGQPRSGISSGPEGERWHHPAGRQFRRRSRETTNAGKLGKLQRLSTALTANSGDLQHLQGSITQLATLLTQVQETAKQQAALVAGKQEASKQLKTSLTEGERLANVLQLAVKQHYGIRSEKLAEFGLQPFRGRTKAKPTPETPEPTPPPTVTPPAGPTAKPPAPASHASTNPETV